MISKLVAMFLIILFMWGISALAHDTAIQNQTRSEARYDYSGKVTAIEYKDAYTTIYLNSEPKRINIRGGKIELKVGEEYTITIDGNFQLINAEIIRFNDAGNK